MQQPRRLSQSLFARQILDEFLVIQDENTYRNPDNKTFGFLSEEKWWSVLQHYSVSGKHAWRIESAFHLVCSLSLQAKFSRKFVDSERKRHTVYMYNFYCIAKQVLRFFRTFNLIHNLQLNTTVSPLSGLMKPFATGARAKWHVQLTLSYVTVDAVTSNPWIKILLQDFR